MKELKLSTKPKIIKNTKVNTIDFVLIFPIKHTNETGLYTDLLRTLLVISNKDIPDEEEFHREKLRKNLLRMNVSTKTAVDNTYLIYQFATPRENLISDFNLEESVSFAVNTIFNPDVCDGGFDIKKFTREKNSLRENIKRSIDGIGAHNSNMFLDIIDPEGELGNTHEESLELIDTITNKKLYEFYKKNILENSYISYVYGNVYPESVEEIFTKYLPKKNEEVKFNINYFKALKMQDHKYQVINTPYNQSEILYEYQVDIPENERHKLSIIFHILNASENNLIFKKVRIENNLVYDIFLVRYLDRAMFIIGAFITPDRIDTLKKLIDDVFRELHDKKYMQQCYDRLMKAMEIDLLYESDNDYNELFDCVYRDTEVKTTKEIIEKYKSVSIDELIEFLDKIKLTNVILFKGGA